MYGALHEYGNELSRYIVTVTAVTSNIDWFNSEQERENQCSGVIISENGLELLILTALFNWWGFVIGTLIIVLSICFNKTLSGRNYLNVKLN